MTIDRDTVVIPDGNQVPQPQGTGKATGFMGDAFHQAAIAQEQPGVVIDDIKPRFIKFSGQRFFGNRHPNGIGNPLPQRAGGGFHARGIAIFWMARRTRMELTEVTNVIHAQVIAGKVQQRVNQHGAMTIRLNITIAVEPLRIFRVMAKVTTPNHFSNIGHSHRCARVAGVGFLNRIDAQDPDGIR